MGVVWGNAVLFRHRSELLLVYCFNELPKTFVIKDYTKILEQNTFL